MQTSRFSETQIVTTLKQADAGVPVKDICRKAGLSVATSYLRGRAKTMGLEPRRVKALEAENATLKRMDAELSLDLTALNDAISRTF